ncbi:MAG TPA: YbhB/YbcL family Raf kinase inhibitor-like protein, partial [Polyangiaceae bacterium]
MVAAGGASAGASQGGSAGAGAGAAGQAAGGGSSAGAGGGGSGTFALTSSKLAAGMTFPTAYTCGGTNQSPPFAWTPGPSGTLSYALVLFDTDANYNHWAVWDMPPSTSMLPESFQKTGTITTPAGAKQTGTGYTGPCPPNNAVHSYVFTIYALDVATLPGVTTSSSAANVSAAIQMHDLASASL